MVRIENVYIIANGCKSESHELARSMEEYLSQKGIKCVVKYTSNSTDTIDVPYQTDMVITLGGDGTVLYAARAVNELGIPILPVNLGTFGYITEVGKDEWKEAFEQYMEKGDNLSRRLMLRISVIRNKIRVFQSSSLNEAVLSSSGIAKVIRLDLLLDKIHAGSFRADGMIVATPTGSTGYSLAAGGPILDCDMNAIIVNPVCPFTLSNRPLVTSGKVVTLHVSENQRTDVVLTVDGQIVFPLEENDDVVIETSRSRMLLIKSGKRTFTEVIREKLHWSGEMHA
ncbi:MAG: NAD(+)/NADH kinase [Candidatus Ornithospirochaeta sp.]|nr:NAD(+)/NADH kinase [Candidatus Ornithospirochaeta sp.]